MYRQKKAFSGFFHTRSVFLQIFVSLLMFLAILIFVVIFWINRISSQEQQRLIVRTNLNRITSADRTIEQVIDDLTGNMTQMTWSKELMSYALLPVADQTRYSQIQNQLQNVARSTWVVKKAVYYCTYSKKIFQSDSSQVLDLDNYYDAWMISLDPEEAPESTLFMRNVERKVDTYLLVRDGRLIVRQDWNLGKHLSVLLYELNTSIVNDVISNSNAHPQDNIYPFDTGGKPVLQGILSYSEVDTDISDLSESQVITLDSQVISRDSRYYLGTGRRLPWTYLMLLNRENLQVSLYSTIHTWLPAILILLAVSVLLCYYVVNAIYHPINRLFSIATSRPAGSIRGSDTSDASPETADGRTKRRSAHPNEFDLLENAYSQAVDQQMKLSQMIEMVAPDIMDHMLVNILSGNNYSGERIDGLLEGIGNPISSRGRFLLCSCVIAEPENRSVSETEWEMYLLSLRKMIQEFSGRGYQIYPVQVDRNTLAILLAFPDEWSAVAIKRVFVEVQRTLMGNAEVLPYRLWVECGQTYSHLTDSREAFLEGMEKIRFRRAGEENRAELPQGNTPAGNRSENEASPAGDGRDTGRMITRIWVRKQCQEIMSLLQKSEQSGVYLTLEQTAEEIIAGSQSMEEIRQRGEWLLEELSEKAMSYPLSNEELELVDIKLLSEKLRSVSDPETMLVTLQMTGRQICDLIYSYNRKNRYKYVDQAKRYIAAHYSDSNLSLNDVAEHVRISSSYLSELFAEISGEKFSGYLAAYRIEKARQQLQTTSDPAREIGSRCGFNSVQNFNRVFKKMTGLTPGQYRENVRDQAT